MTSHKRLVAMGLALFVVHTAFAEGSFFKDRREAATQVKPSAPSVQAPPVQAPAPAPVPVARDVEQSDARVTTGPAPPREEPVPPPEQHLSGSAQPQPSEQHGSGSAQPPAPTAAAPADISGQVSEVPSTDTLVVAGQRVTLVGIRGVSEMTQPLQRWIASTGNSVTCHPVATRYRCTTANGSDIGQVVLSNGGGTATPDAPANYRGAEMQARMGRRGIWRQR